MIEITYVLGLRTAIDLMSPTNGYQDQSNILILAYINTVWQSHVLRVYVNLPQNLDHTRMQNCKIFFPPHIWKNSKLSPLRNALFVYFIRFLVPNCFSLFLIFARTSVLWKKITALSLSLLFSFMFSLTYFTYFSFIIQIILFCVCVCVCVGVCVQG